MSEMKKWKHLKIQFEKIKYATNDFRKCIGRDGYGRLYEGELFINQKFTRIAVKRMSDEFGQGIEQFLTEIQFLATHKHENLVTLVGYCDESDEMIIVYEYALHGSLDRYIRYFDDTVTSTSTSTSKKYTLTWVERLKIVVDVARGLDRLHNHSGVHQAIIHRDIKCRNIFIFDNWVAKIGNLGFSISCFTGLSESMVISNPSGTPGYVDPSSIFTGIVTTKTDVYSFGMLLFEVLCGRLCYVRDKDGILLTAELAKEYYDNRKLGIIVDPSLRKQVCLNSLRKFSTIAYKCLKDPEQRPLIQTVFKELQEMLKHEMKQEDARGTLKCSSISCETLKKKLPIQRFSVAEINRAIDVSCHEKPLGEGAFGKVYRCNISGNEVAVKRMRINPEQGIPAFRKEINLLSACNQENIISLVGYCDEDEMILIYEYMPNGSLFDYLFSHQDDTPQLTVEQRLEICIGVAKGLSYLHSRTDFNIIHCDIKTDNILLDCNLVPKISDFGLSRTHDVGPLASDVVTNNIQGTEGYIAPECYEPNHKLSRKADVYAFGVVLLEVLCERVPWKRLVLLALPVIMRGELHKLTPQHVKTTISLECLRECEIIIWRCLENDPDKRPVMNEVVDRLEFALKLQTQNCSLEVANYNR